MRYGALILLYLSQHYSSLSCLSKSLTVHPAAYLALATSRDLYVVRYFPKEKGRKSSTLSFSGKLTDHWLQCEEGFAHCQHFWLVVCGMMPSDSEQWTQHSRWKSMPAAEPDLRWQTDESLYPQWAWHSRDAEAQPWHRLSFPLESQAWAHTRTNTHRR